MIVEVGDVHHQSAAFPVAARIAHPEIEPVQMFAAVQINGSVGVRVLIDDREILARLKNLKRHREQRDPRHARQVAFLDGVGGLAILEILLPLPERVGAIRNLAIGRVDHKLFEVLRRRSLGLPDTLQIGLREAGQRNPGHRNNDE
ncbi:MAG: hypothetical protein ACLPWF_17200 [Bryobacteraceae bacterium]